MPAKSQAQFRFMTAACAKRAVAKRHGIPQSVACEFVRETPHPGDLPERARAAQKAIRKRRKKAS